jgi:hypothetical protein
MATLGGYLNSKTPPKLYQPHQLANILTRESPDCDSRLSYSCRNFVSMRSINQLSMFPDPREEAKAHSTCLGLEHRRGTNHPNARRR